MSLKKSIMLAFSLVITTAAAFNSSIAFADAVGDAAISAEVKARLISEKDIPSNISVSTIDSVVTLEGAVDTSLQAHQAIEVASSINNVKDVVDTQLKVKESKSLMADALITAKIKGKIRYLYANNKILKGYDLHVETTDHVVHIFGSVARPADLETVVAVAKDVTGVKSVKTNI